METITLTIPDMKSPHCQMAVTNAVRKAGASVKEVGPSRASIELIGGVTKQSIVSAIQKAGYRVV